MKKGSCRQKGILLERCLFLKFFKESILKKASLQAMLFCQLILFLFFSTYLSAQEDKQPIIAVNGYVKNLQGLIFTKLPGAESDLVLDNLLHHRLNSKLFISSKLLLKVDFRNRIFYGDGVRSTPDFDRLIDDVNNDYADLSTVWLRHDAMVGHSMIDRLYLEYTSWEWELRLGRQRINWGISTVWNPNDIFNAFSFTDFDYEERPGSDALRIKRYLGFISSVEIAVKAFDTWDEAVMAFLYRFNKWSYDVQVLGGYAQEDFVLGLGWAGNLGNAGLKGESSWFSPVNGEGDNSFAATVGIDYTFKNGIYIQWGYLFNSNGSRDRTVTQLFDFDLSAKNLYPYESAVFLQLSNSLNPLLTGGLAVIYSPVKVHALFINPTMSYSISQNWDLDFVGQVVFDREPPYRSRIQAFFLRVKCSY